MSTKEKLIEAALKLFGENGYNGTSTRDICNLAGVNSASIGYHFGDKRSLYLAVLQCEIGSSESLQQNTPEGTAEERILQIVEASLRDVFSNREGPRGKLALREVTSPSQELLELIGQTITQRFDYLVDCVEELAPTDTPKDNLRMMALSIIGQIEHYRFHYKFLPLFLGEEKAAALDPKSVAAHIVEFSLRGITR